MAFELARAGLHLVITARRGEVLEALATELSAQFKVKVMVVAADLSTDAGTEQLFQRTDSLEIGLVVANAGYGSSGPFVDGNLSTELNMLDLNCRAVLQLSHHFSQRFKAQKKGGIILLGSLVGYQGVPNSAHYAATKAYVNSLGEALAIELKPEGVDVLVVSPGPVHTEFAARANLSISQAITPDTVVVQALSALGRKNTLLPGFLTKFLSFSLGFLPRWAKVRVMGKVMEGMHAG